MCKRLMQYMLAGLLLLPSFSLLSQEYKRENGPAKVSTVERITLEDGQRNKTLHLFVSYPEIEGPLPVIIFSHGAMGSGDMGFPIVEHWSSHGYIVICPTHSDSLKLKRESGQRITNPLDSIRRSGKSSGEWDDVWSDRPRDISLVIDSLAKIENLIPELAEKIDAERIGVGGHSLGAYTAQLIGGATVKMPGHTEPQSFGDDRVKAILQLSGQGTDQQGLHRDSWKSVTLPMMCVTGSRDRAAQGQPPSWRREPFELSPPGDKYFVFIEGAHHGSFTGKSALDLPRNLQPQDNDSDQTERSSGIRDRIKNLRGNQNPDRTLDGKLADRLAERAQQDQAKILDWVKQATIAFWDHTLRNDDQAKDFLSKDNLRTSSHQAVNIERK
jgi:predicted dienelactone hydrolase